MLCKQRLMAAFILTAVLTFPAFGDDNSSWSNLGGLNRRDRIGIILTDNRRIEGRFEGFTDADISLRSDQLFTLSKDRVLRVYRRPRMRRTLRMLIGVAAGGAVGAVLTATVGDRYRNEGQDVPAGLWIAGGAGIGAVVSAIIGSGDRTLYQRR
jgi:hypothetical protein